MESGTAWQAVKDGWQAVLNMLKTLMGRWTPNVGRANASVHHHLFITWSTIEPIKLLGHNGSVDRVGVNLA